jgi:hypothetical protein
MIEKMFLNRPQLILERRVYSVLEAVRIYENILRGVIQKLESNSSAKAKKYLSRISRIILDISSLKTSLRTIPPYKQADITRKGKC